MSGVEKTVEAVRKRFPEISHSISYQSRLGRTEWLKPDTVEEVIRLGREGIKRLIVVPVSFVSDHIETLHELDIRLRETAREADRHVPAGSGLKRLARVHRGAQGYRAFAAIGRRSFYTTWEIMSFPRGKQCVSP